MVTSAGNGFALVMGRMGLDEVLSFHERLEAALGVDWQILYIPVVALAAICWTLVLTRLRPFGRLVLLVGAGAWFASQVLVLLQ